MRPTLGLDEVYQLTTTTGDSLRTEKYMGQIARKATFTVQKIKGKRVFTAVNRRAHTVARKAGKRTKVTVADLKKLKGTGSYKYYQYTETGLKAIVL